LAYRARPYLSHLSVDELTNRSQDVMANIGDLTPEGQIGLHLPVGSVGYPWMELWAHVIEEFGRRGLGIPTNALDRETMPRPSAPTPAKGYLESRRFNLDFPRCLTKYGSRSWLGKTLETGEWRVSPASYYSDTSLNKARRDSELEFPIRIARFEKTTRPLEDWDGEYYHQFVGVIEWVMKAPSDYYLVCMARGLIFRMFDDFGSDACLVIHNEKEFARRMLTAFDAVNPQWFGTFRAVDYIDPCMPKPPIDIRFAKHFRYSYQEEQRFAWIPPLGIATFPQITISLGPLGDICELLLLDGEILTRAGG